MHAQGFDVLTWRKGPAEDVDPDLFADLTYIDQTGRSHQWRVADTTVDLPTGDDDQVFTMRQGALLVAGNKTSRDRDGQDSTRQIHILITRGDHDRLTTDLRAAESNRNTAQAAHRAIPARLPLAQVNLNRPGSDGGPEKRGHGRRPRPWRVAVAFAVFLVESSIGTVAEKNVSAIRPGGGVSAAEPKGDTPRP